MASLSKSKLLAYRQCPKRVWLEVHRPDLREESAYTAAAFGIGHDVGSLARRLYDPAQTGALIEVEKEGFTGAFARTRQLVATSSAPIFEAGFKAAGALAFADILLPVSEGPQPAWRMVEIKSSASVKPYHHDDAAIQHYITTQAGVPLCGIAVGHIDTSWVYPGGGNYRGIFVEHDLTEEASARHAEVRDWIADAGAIVAGTTAPARTPGSHCTKPYECGFRSFCGDKEPQVEFPVSWLPGPQRAQLKQLLADPNVRSLDQVPDGLLNRSQRRVKNHTLAGTTYFDRASAAEAMRQVPLPALFLDFESISFVVPIWPGTRPYQQIPFQYSLHRLAVDGTLGHHEFLDLSGDDPSRKIAEDLVRECAGDAPVFAYSKSFEGRCLRQLAERYDDLREPLLHLARRLFDLLPVVRRTYYHPSQQGSWGLKAVLPALVPGPSYDALDGVQDGGDIQSVYSEAVDATTTPERKAEIKRQLLAYCHLDTLAMVKLRDSLLATVL